MPSKPLSCWPPLKRKLKTKRGYWTYYCVPEFRIPTKPALRINIMMAQKARNIHYEPECYDQNNISSAELTY